MFQGEATAARLCLLLIIILTPRVYSGAIYLRTNIISLLISPCVFTSSGPLSVYQPRMIFLQILARICNAAASNPTSLPLKVQHRCVTAIAATACSWCWDCIHTWGNEGAQTRLFGNGCITYFMKFSIHPFTGVKQYPGKVWLLNCTTGVPQIGKATAFTAIEAPGADKRELIKNKNLIKLQQQLQGSNAACKGSLFIRQSHETHYRTVGRRNNMADIDQREGSSLNTYGRRRRCTCQNIDEIYPISDSDAFHFEARVSPCESEAASAARWWSPGWACSSDNEV